MRLGISKSKNATSLYVIKTVYENKKQITKRVEKLGTVAELEKKLNGQDPILWARQYIDTLNEKEKSSNKEILIKKSPNKIIDSNIQNNFNCGYLFLKDIYYNLALDKICDNIQNKYSFKYDLNSILSSLLFSRIIYPSSKLSSFEHSKNYIEQPNFELSHIYKALRVLSQESDFIQAELYKNSEKAYGRNSKVLYYDCTNYFFEIESEDGCKQYGKSKENRPNPIVSMGLFMDADGIPLAFNIDKGNTNEQITLKPLEKKIIKDFQLSKFVVCTDAGLASTNNRKFNNIADRYFITTQSTKMLKAHLKDWALDPTGWSICGRDGKQYDITKLNEEKAKEITFYKERWINENGLEQRLIVTYSIKYRDYQRNIRNNQLERAQKKIESNPKSIGKVRSNDYKRFINKKSITDDGEVALKETYTIDYDKVSAEAAHDGIYAVCTNLNDSVRKIVKINHSRWKIEECFRIMKSEFKARPVYLQRDDCIEAHFMTCFLSLTLYRYLEKTLEYKYTQREIIETIRTMNMHKVIGEGYIPNYTRTELTDLLHTKFNFRTDYEIVTNKEIKKIIKIITK